MSSIELDYEWLLARLNAIKFRMMDGQNNRLMEQFDVSEMRPPPTTVAAASTYSHTIEAEFERIERYVDIIMKTVEEVYPNPPDRY